MHQQELVFASFNQDTTSLAVGANAGYKLYSLTSTDSLDPIYSNGNFDNKSFPNAKSIIFLRSNGGRLHRRAAIFQQLGGHRFPIGTAQAQSLPFQKRHGDLQLQLHFENLGCQNEPSEIGRLPGRIIVHPQYTRYEGSSYHPRNATKQEWTLCFVH